MGGITNRLCEALVVPAAKVAVLSAKEHSPNLIPVLLYGGSTGVPSLTGQANIHWFREQGGIVYHHNLTFMSDLQARIGLSFCCNSAFPILLFGCMRCHCKSGLEAHALIDLKSACSVVSSPVPALCIYDVSKYAQLLLKEDVFPLTVAVVDRLCDYVPHTV